MGYKIFADFLGLWKEGVKRQWSRALTQCYCCVHIGIV